MFEVEMSYDYLQHHRKQIGIQGSWEAYFTLFKQAATTIDWCGELELEVFYPLMEGARIRGTF